MPKNKVAKTLWIIGIVEAACGIIAGIVVLAEGDVDGWVGFAVMLSSFITCMLFIGFGEIINLLQKNTEKQDALLVYLKTRPSGEEYNPQSVLEDIEFNLPEM